MNARTVGALGVAVVVVGSTLAWSADAGKPVAPAPRPLVQLAVLLDTSGSMEGMIKQAQTQLWAIVNEFATAERDGQKPIAARLALECQDAQKTSARSHDVPKRPT